MERDDIETMTQVWLRNSSGAPRNLLLTQWVGTWQPNTANRGADSLLWVIYVTSVDGILVQPTSAWSQKSLQGSNSN